MNGTIDHVDTNSGTGTSGKIRCVFLAGSPTPATNWFLDGGPTAHAVQTVAGAFVSVPATGHTLSFTTTAGNTPPPNTPFTIAAGQQKTFWVKYT